MRKREPKLSDKAVALKFRKDADSAPTVVAKGQGYVAETIKETARRNGIPIHRDDDLIELLAHVEIDRQIPPELYAAVAEILSWIYRANETLKKEIT